MGIQIAGIDRALILGRQECLTGMLIFFAVIHGAPSSESAEIVSLGGMLATLCKQKVRIIIRITIQRELTSSHSSNFVLLPTTTSMLR